ncbi:MAG: hypothetical protein GXY76_00190 [Chloroflexi bacterium]|nr:hypothetical protein [Chloroflexota bacterium]
MPQDKVALVVMTGLHGESEVEQMMNGALAAATLDTVDKALAAGNIGPIIVSTNSASLQETLREWPVLVERDSTEEPFHFGLRLREIINQHHLEKVIYMGGGSGVLLSVEELRQIAEELLKEERLLITNNFYSTDFCGFTPGSHINAIHVPPYDNDLGWRMGQGGGLPNVSLPRTASTQLDIDTPVDLMVLTYDPTVGKHLRAHLDSLEMDTAPIRQAMRFLVNRTTEVILAGRVSSAILAYMEKEAACRVRVFSEERGMRASGRQTRGEVRSLLGHLYQSAGPRRFFNTLAEMGQALFFDNRVLWVHCGVWPSASDRFYSDLRQPDKIEDDFVRTLTEAALESPIPVIMGGHSLVSGDMYVIVDRAWDITQVDLPRWVNHTFWGDPTPKKRK